MFHPPSYRFDATHNCCVAKFDDSRSVCRPNRIHIDANRTEFIEISSIRSNIVIYVVAIVFNWMNCPAVMK